MTFDPRSHLPFKYVEHAVGQPASFKKICEAAGLGRAVTTTMPPQIRLHTGRRDMIAATAGKRVYCLSLPSLPKGTKATAIAIMERLAYGAGDWAATETLRAHRRKTDNEKMIGAEPAEETKRRDAFRETLHLRRLLRGNPSIGDSEAAETLGCAVDEILRLRGIVHDLDQTTTT